MRDDGGGGAFDVQETEEEMSWKRWKLGAAMAIFMSLLVAGSGLAAGMKWQAFVAVFCMACATHFGAFLKDHPPDAVSFGDTQQFTKSQVAAGTAGSQVEKQNE